MLATCQSLQPLLPPNQFPSRLVTFLLVPCQFQFLSWLATGPANLLLGGSLSAARFDSCPWFSVVSLLQLSQVSLQQQPVECELQQFPVPLLVLFPGPSPVELKQQHVELAT